MFITIAAVCLFLIPTSVNACSCFRDGPSGEFSTSKAVFVGKVIGGTEKISRKDESGKPYTLEAGEVRFEVEEIFKGSPGYEITLDIPSMNPTSCGIYGLKQNVRYVVYAREDKNNPDIYYIGLCTRTAAIDSEYAKEDLDFLHNLPAAGSGGNLSVSIWADLRGGDKPPLKDVPLKITRKSDNETISAKTDSSGHFEMKKVKPGVYVVEPELPTHYVTEHSSEEVTVEDRASAGAGFIAYMDGQISGYVVDRDGRPYNHISIDLDGDGKSISGFSTGSEGKFLASGVPPGTYLMYVEMQHGRFEPGRKFYYPGTFKLEEAKSIKVDLGEKVDQLIFQLPDPYKVRTVEGQVVWADGKPAAGVEVWLGCPQNLDPAGFTVEFLSGTVWTDDEGRFPLEGFTCEVYWLGARGVKQGDTGKQAGWMNAQSKKIILTDNLKDLKVVLSEKGFSSGGGCGKN